MLEHIDLHRKSSKAEYKKRLPSLQSRLHQLQQACWQNKLASLLVFDGWTTSGKDTAIQKLTERLEPRGFDLHTIVGPRSLERHMPWLWRFWNKVPHYGHMAIFRRSWNRRVLVERVEGEVGESQWRQAYEDIAGFERTLAEDRYEVVKFFLHIDREEQATRLESWRNDRSTAWQVKSDPTDATQYEAYLEAAEELLERTEAEWAPWFIIEATDRRWARLKIFETAIRRLEEGLRKRGYGVPEAYEYQHPEPWPSVADEAPGHGVSEEAG